MSRILSSLRKGEILVLPTDTLYALSCDATNTAAVDKLISIKGRQKNHPLPILVKDAAQARKFAEFNTSANELVSKHWPGALTLVLPLKADSNLSPSIYGDLKTVAIRAPKGWIRKILEEYENPLVGTSANISGQENLNTREQFKEAFGNSVSEIVLSDDMQSIHSTIVDCTGSIPKIIRQGAVII